MTKKIEMVLFIGSFPLYRPYDRLLKKNLKASPKPEIDSKVNSLHASLFPPAKMKIEIAFAYFALLIGPFPII